MVGRADHLGPGAHAVAVVRVRRIGARGADRTAEAVLDHGCEALGPVQGGLGHLAIDIGAGGGLVDQLDPVRLIADAIDLARRGPGLDDVGEGPADRAGGDDAVGVGAIAARIEVQGQGPAEVGGAQHDQL